MSPTTHRPRAPRRTRLVLAVVSTLLLGAVSWTPAPASGAAPRGTATSAQAPGSGSATRPTIVLVHGAFADAGGWTQEVIALQRLGFEVVAPPNPLRGLTYDADYLRSVLATIPGPVVLVGHSYGGAVITNAARGAANVEALVYVAAFVPDEGQSILTSYDPATYPGSLLGPDTVSIRPTYNPAAPGGQDVDVSIAPSAFRAVFAGDQRADVAAAMAATQRPLAAFAQTEPSGVPAWRTVPSWDLVTLEDRAISPGGQLFMAQRAGAHVERVRSAHDVMVSHPGAVVRIVLEAVAGLG